MYICRKHKYANGSPLISIQIKVQPKNLYALFVINLTYIVKVVLGINGNGGFA